MRLIKYITPLMSLPVLLLAYYAMLPSVFDGQGIAEHRIVLIALLILTAYYAFVFYQFKLGWKQHERNYLLNAFWARLLPFIIVVACIAFVMMMGSRMHC